MSEHRWQTCNYKTTVGPEHVQAGLDKYKGWFPPSADMIHSYRDQVIRAVVNKTCPSDGSPMRNETYPTHDDLALVVRKRARRANDTRIVDVSPCQQAIVKVVISSVGYLLQVIGGAGLAAAINEDDELAVKVTEEMTENEVTQALIQKIGLDISVAFEQKDWEKAAMGVWKMITAYHETTSLKDFFDALQEDLAWWEWVCTGVAVIAQCLIWFEPAGGLVAVGELVMDIATAGGVISDYVDLGSKCR